MCNPKPGPRCDTDVLTRLIDRLGVQRGRLDDENVEMRCELLVTRGGLSALAQQIKDTSDPEERQALLASYKTGYNNFMHRMKLINRRPFPIPNHPEDLDTVEAETDVENLQKAAYGIYGHKDSPLYHKARQIESKFTAKTNGYKPGEPKTEVYETRSLAASMNADLSHLPPGAVAIDVETDTSNGFGLQPHRTQITEMVIADKDRTIVLSGDERHILQGFADYMNSRHEDTQIVGWNNSGFDNPTLAVRGSYHADSLKGWGMEVEDAPVSGTYNPVGGFEANQSMTWTTPDGKIYCDRDVMVEIKNSPIHPDGASIRLKPTARRWGMNPVEIDRSRMHEYTPEQRQAYVASDGISTLHNLSEFIKRTS